MTLEIGMAVAICAMAGWKMTRAKRYAANPAKGFGVGAVFGGLMLMPLVALLPIYLWPMAPEWVDNAWVAVTLLYEVAVWMTMARHKAGLGFKLSNSSSQEAEASLGLEAGSAA